MRPKVTLLIVLTGILLVMGLYWLGQRTSPGLPTVPKTGQPAASPAAAPSPPGAAAQQPPAPAMSVGQTSPAGPGDTSPAPAVPAPPSMDEAAIEARIETLGDLALEDDPTSLQTILSELRNPHQAIRQAALEAVREFGSRDAIPHLKELAAATEDPQQRQEFLETVAYLELPTLTELRARQRKAQAIKPPAPQPAPQP